MGQIPIMYLIAWTIVEAENTESWNWFLELLAIDVDIQSNAASNFNSDRQKVENSNYNFISDSLYGHQQILTTVYFSAGFDQFLYKYCPKCRS